MKIIVKKKKIQKDNDMNENNKQEWEEHKVNNQYNWNYDNFVPQGLMTYNRNEWIDSSKDPIVTDQLKSVGYNSFDMDTRIYIAFEVIRRTCIYQKEKTPIPFEIYANYMLSVDKGINLNPQIIDNIMNEMDKNGYIRIHKQGIKGFVIELLGALSKCPLCNIKLADTILFPCRHSLCYTCSRKHSIQPIGSNGVEKCPFCEKSITQYDQLSKSGEKIGETFPSWNNTSYGWNPLSGQSEFVYPYKDRLTNTQGQNRNGRQENHNNSINFSSLFSSNFV